MDLIKEKLKENRPNLSDNSIKTYISLLNNIYKKVNINDTFNIDFFLKYYKDILKYLNNENLNSRKTILAAIVSLLGNNSIVEIYRHKMMDDISKKNYIDDEQLMDEKQSKNILNQEEIKTVYNYYYKRYLSLDIKKNNFDMLNKKDYFIYQSYILLCLISGIFIPPRRLLDYTNLKFNNDNINNFYKKGYLYFKKYKTDKIYGEQKIKIPQKLDTIIKQFIKYRFLNDYGNDNFFITINNKHLTPSQLNQYINIVFSNVLQRKINIGINGLRHSYITAKYENIPSIKDIKKTAENMGHSVNQALLYIKK
jgi:hypothetical protein